MAAGAIGVSSREWPTQHHAAWPRRTCAKSHAGETEARRDEEKSLSAKVGREQAAAGSSIRAAPFHWVHGDWWQGGYHQFSQGTRIGDSHADGCGTGRHVPCWVAPEGRCPAASSRAGGCTPGCHTGAGRPGTGWAMPSAAGVGLRHDPAPGAYPTSLFAVVLHVRSKPAPLAAKFALLGLVEAPQKASAQPRCRRGGRGSRLPHSRQQSHISAAFVVLQKITVSPHHHGHGPT